MKSKDRGAHCKGKHQPKPKQCHHNGALCPALGPEDGWLVDACSTQTAAREPAALQHRRVFWGGIPEKARGQEQGRDGSAGVQGIPGGLQLRLRELPPWGPALCRSMWLSTTASGDSLQAHNKHSLLTPGTGPGQELHAEQPARCKPTSYQHVIRAEPPAPSSAQRHVEPEDRTLQKMGTAV